MTIEDLTEAVGGIGRPGARVVSEVLAALDRIDEVNQCPGDDGGLRFSLNEASRLQERQVIERTIEKRFDFVPRSRQFEQNIRGITKGKLKDLASGGNLRWCKLPDETELYSTEILKQSIKKACCEYYRPGGSVKVYYEENESRLEFLQRSKLISTDPRFIDADVVRANPTESWVLHRCYLYRTGASGRLRVSALIYGYPRGPEEQGYRDYLNDLMRKLPEVERNLLDASEPV